MEKNGSKIWSVISIVLIVLLCLILTMNLAIIIQGFANPGDPPSIFGITPLVVLSGSMEGDNEDSFDEGSLIFVKDVDTKSLEIGDVIAFKDPKSSEGAIITHRIVDIETYGNAGARAFKTQGDANNDADKRLITEENVVGKYVTHISNVGNVLMFIQEPYGMMIVIGVPVVAVIVIDVLRRRKQGKANEAQTSQLEEELARLRKLAAELEAKEADEPADAESSIKEESAAEETSANAEK